MVFVCGHNKGKISQKQRTKFRINQGRSNPLRGQFKNCGSSRNSSAKCEDRNREEMLGRPESSVISKDDWLAGNSFSVGLKLGI